MITYEQAMTTREFHKEGACTRTVGPRGGVTVKVEVWRRNGKTQTWKTRPGEFRLPIKWGLKCYDAVTDKDAHLLHVAEECPLNGKDD